MFYIVQYLIVLALLVCFIVFVAIPLYRKATRKKKVGKKEKKLSPRQLYKKAEERLEEAKKSLKDATGAAKGEKIAAKERVKEAEILLEKAAKLDLSITKGGKK